MPEIEVSGLMVMTSVMIWHLLTGKGRGLLGERKNQEMVPRSRKKPEESWRPGAGGRHHQ